MSLMPSDSMDAQQQQRKQMLPHLTSTLAMYHVSITRKEVLTAQVQIPADSVSAVVCQLVALLHDP
jgi:hypothetical protein